MRKMLWDPKESIAMTKNGNATLQEIQIKHPGSKSMIEISWTWDNVFGDGILSVIIHMGKMSSMVEHLVSHQMH